jgi:GntR family transcriptional repressor for pyruvate dehydrogenase complex
MCSVSSFVAVAGAARSPSHPLVTAPAARLGGAQHSGHHGQHGFARPCASRLCGVTVRSAIIPPVVLRLTSQGRVRNFTDLVEARRPIELALARLAVARAGQEDLAEMRRACELLEHSIGRTDAWVDADSMFHAAIGRVAHSELLACFQIETVKELALLLTHDWTPRDVSDPQATIREPRPILDALDRRDEEAVERAVQEHLKELELLVTPARSPKRP